MKPNTLSHDARAAHFGVTGAITEIACRALSGAFAWLNRRRQTRNAMGHLANLNERLLADIGLPGEQLRRVRREKRLRERAETWRRLL